MDALANYDSDDEKDEKQSNLKDDTGKSNIAGDNYDNVQMDLSEENSSSSSKTGWRDEVLPASAQHLDRSSSMREDRRRGREQTEKRQHGRDRRRSPTHHSSSRHQGGGRERHRTDERRGHGNKRSPPRRRSRDRSRSPSRRSPGRSSRREHRRRSRSRSPGPSTSSSSRSARTEASSSSTGREKSGSISPPSLTSEQYLASLSLAQKLAQQVQPNAQQKTGLLGATPGMNRIQEQLQRRRMLWQQNKEPKDVPGPSNNNWEGALLPKDQDGTMTAKFKRLMGMKGPATEAATAAAVNSTETAQQQLKKTDDMLQDMERQYEVARLATHTHRGLGLGFGAFQCNYPR